MPSPRQVSRGSALPNPLARRSMSVSVAQQKMFVDGEFVDALSGETMEVLNPATGEVIAEVPRAGEEDVDRAVAAAERAWETWREKTPKDRMELLLELADVIDDNAEELARLESRNVGKPWWVAVDEPGRDVRQPPLLRRRGAEPRGQGRRGVRRGLHVDDPPRAARHRRRDRAVELPALHGDLEDGPGARRRERPDRQAGRADAADGRCASSSSRRRSSRRASSRS